MHLRYHNLRIETIRTTLLSLPTVKCLTIIPHFTGAKVTEYLIPSSNYFQSRAKNMTQLSIHAPSALFVTTHSARPREKVL